MHISRGKYAPSVVSVKPGKGKTSNKPGKGKKSKGKGESLSNHLKREVGKHASHLWDWVVRKIFDNAKAAVVRRQDALAAIAESDKDNKDAKMPPSDVKSGWYLLPSKVDRKSLDSTVADCDKLIAAYRAELAGYMKGKPLSISLPRALDAYAIATVTTGVVSNVVAIAASDLAEWSTMVALFEEYKMSGLSIHHNSVAQGPAGATTASGLFRTSVADPGDGTALTSTLQAVQYGFKEVEPLGFASAAVVNHGRVWNVHLPRGNMFTNAGALYAAQDEWLPVNATVSTLPVYCYIKHYWVGSTVTAVAVDSAIMYYHVHFRSRQ